MIVDSNNENRIILSSKFKSYETFNVIFKKNSEQLIEAEIGEIFI